MANQSEHLGQVTLEGYSTTPLFNTKAVVRQTGVPAPTLRAWERRYGILAPQRGPNDYRLYSERDIALVSWLRHQVEGGLNISQAIALLRSMRLPHSEPERPLERQIQPANGSSAADRQMPLRLRVQPHQAKAADTGEAAEGTTSQLASMTAELLAAFVRLDEMAAQSALASIFAVFSVEQAITDILQPILETIGERWQAGELSITTEHFAATLIRSRLSALLYALPMSASGPLVLVGCAPGEQHELGALTLALLLRRQRSGLRVIYLGQNVEPAHLLKTIQLQRPAVVCLSAALAERRPAVADVARRVSALPSQQRPVLVYGGRAFPQEAAEIEGVFLGSQAMQAVAPIERFCATRPLVHS